MFDDNNIASFLLSEPIKKSWKQSMHRARLSYDIYEQQ